MNSLFNNAVQSIQLGMEDFASSDPRRVLSTVRNIYAGVLLLAKEALVRSVPNAQPEELLGERYEPVPDGNGGVIFQQASRRTIDFVTIGKRFRAFNLKIDDKALEDLNKIRNDIEHHSTQRPVQSIREAIAKALPVVADLYRLAGEVPSDTLGPAWHAMLEVRDVHEKELAECRSTFDDIAWESSVLSEAAFKCPDCDSYLVQQEDAANRNIQDAHCRCRACGNSLPVEEVVATALSAHLEYEAYTAHKESGDAPLYDCPDCQVASYVIYEGEVGCVLCGLALGECGLCSAGLTPDNVSDDSQEFCGYCQNKLTKDD